MSQYLESTDFLENLSYDPSKIVLLNTAQYNESKLLAFIIGNCDADQLFACALSMAISGVGNGDYGRVQFRDTEFDVKTLLANNNVNMNARQDAKLAEDELTPKRVLRLFRYHIKKYINETGTESYLFRKYRASNSIPEYTFPGAEHLIEVNDISKLQALYNTYKNLDSSKNSNFCERIVQVYTARGVDMSRINT